MKVSIFCFFCFLFFCRRLADSTFADVCFLVHDQSFHLHKCILSARSAYFAEMFVSKWKDKPLIQLKHPLVSTIRQKVQSAFAGGLVFSRIGFFITSARNRVRSPRSLRKPCDGAYHYSKQTMAIYVMHHEPYLTTTT